MVENSRERVILCSDCAGTGFDRKRSRRMRCETCGGSGLSKTSNVSFLDDPRHWRMRGEEARSLAEDMRDQDAKAMMLRIAEDYENIASRIDCINLGAHWFGENTSTDVA